MFINFWYPAARSTELTGEPFRRRMLGQDFVLFRDSRGTAHCLSDICIHRGGSLSGGRIRGDCVQCPYHGWQFDGDGMCRRIPSLGPDAKIPARARLDSYPVVERFGLVFAFLGDLPEQERPPIMDIPEFGQAGWRQTIQYFEWDLDYKRSIENGLDLAHNEFVHPTHGFSGTNDSYRVPDIELVASEWGTGFFNQMFVPPLADKQMQAHSGRADNATINVGTGHHGIASVWTFINPTPAMHIYQYLYETPVDDARTSLYLVNMRNFLLEPENDQRMMDRNQYVAFQDRDVLLDLDPVLTPRSQNHELLLPSDRCIGRYRDLIRRWESWGWRIDSGTVAANRRKTAYAIPSPARRGAKGWVLDPVPLLPKTAEPAIAEQPRFEAARKG